MLEYAAGLANCRVISVDSREAWMERTSYRALGPACAWDQQPRPILGLEMQNDEIAWECSIKD